MPRRPHSFCRPLLSLVALGSLWLLAVGCETRNDDALRLTGATMGTRWSVRVALDASPPLSTAAITAEIQSTLDRINALMSTYREDSEVTRFNREPAGRAFPISAETAHVVAAATAISQQTDGAFDITVGPLVALWHFGAQAAADERAIPTPQAIDQVRAHVGFDHLAFQADPPTLQKDADATQIDLSAIAKGFAVDCVAQRLTELGMENFLVEIGGEVRTRGTRPGGGAWRVGIEMPTDDARRVHTSIPLQNAALATSGDYRNFFEQNAIRYSHIIDPRTGRPVEHQLASVSVIADDCLTADALATALLVMGPDAGAAWIETHHVRALLIIRTDSGFTQQASTAWQQATR